MKYKNGIFCGCFDLYHVGHQRAIQYCKDRCAILTIGLFTDEAIMGYKGHYPAGCKSQGAYKEAFCIPGKQAPQIFRRPQS
jgi:cytidyltransferase-like protein